MLLLGAGVRVVRASTGGGAPASAEARAALHRQIAGGGQRPVGEGRPVGQGGEGTPRWVADGSGAVADTAGIFLEHGQ